MFVCYTPTHALQIKNNFINGLELLGGGSVHHKIYIKRSQLSPTDEVHCEGGGDGEREAMRAKRSEVRAGQHSLHMIGLIQFKPTESTWVVRIALAKRFSSPTCHCFQCEGRR